MLRSDQPQNTSQGGQQLLYGAALVLTAIVQARARHSDTALSELGRDIIR